MLVCIILYVDYNRTDIKISIYYIFNKFILFSDKIVVSLGCMYIQKIQSTDEFLKVILTQTQELDSECVTV